MPVVIPTVGRKVWFRPNEQDRNNLAVQGDQPLDATIVAVHGNNCINIAGYDANGAPYVRSSAYLLQDGEDLPSWVTSYVEWMPYQKAQATKHASTDDQATS